MVYSKVKGVGSYLPEKVLTNQELETMIDTTDEWIKKRVGIEQRHIVGEGQSASDMALLAAQKALNNAGCSATELDMIIVGNATSDYYFPSVACFVQAQLGVSGIPAFDVSAACAGFIYALSVGDQYIKSGSAKRVLVIGVEALSRVVDWSDRSTCVLFGDGAGAFVIESSDEPGIVSTHIHADGQYSDLLFAHSGLSPNEDNHCLQMDGNATFKVAVTKLGEIVDETLRDNQLQKSDIDWLIPHQANMRIIQATAKRLNMPMERVILTVAKHGNTSAASVPLAMDAAIAQGKVKRGDLCLLEAFGAGFAWGSALIRY